MKNLLGNEKGVSLVSVTIAAGLMGMLALFMMRMQENQLKTQNDLTMKSEANLFLNKLSQVLNRPGYCEVVFEGKLIEPDGKLSLEKISTPTGKVLYQVGELYGNRTFKLLSVEQKDFFYDNDAKNRGILTLSLGMEKNKKSFGSKVIKKDLELLVMVEGGKVTSCSASGGGSITALDELDKDTKISDVEVKKVIMNKDLESIDPKDEKKVREVIENNPHLKIMQDAIKKMQENNKAYEEFQKNNVE